MGGARKCCSTLLRYRNAPSPARHENSPAASRRDSHSQAAGRTRSPAPHADHMAQHMAPTASIHNAHNGAHTSSRAAVRRCSSPAAAAEQVTALAGYDNGPDQSRIRTGAGTQPRSARWGATSGAHAHTAILSNGAQGSAQHRPRSHSEHGSRAHDMGCSRRNMSWAEARGCAEGAGAPAPSDAMACHYVPDCGAVGQTHTQGPASGGKGGLWIFRR